MNTMLRFALPCALLLAACGADDTDGVAASEAALSASTIVSRAGIDDFIVGGTSVYFTAPNGTCTVPNAVYSATNAPGASPILHFWATTCTPFRAVRAVGTSIFALGGGNLVRKDLSAPGPVILASTGTIDQTDLEADASFLYWGDSVGLRREPVGGGPPTTLVAGNLRKSSLAQDATYVFFFDGLSIRRYTKATGLVTTLANIGGADFPWSDVALDATYVYFTDPVGVRRVARTGGAVTTLVAAPSGNSPNGIATDTTYVFWSEGLPGGTTRMRRARKDGTGATTLSSGLASAFPVRADGLYVYYDDGTGIQRRASDALIY